MRKALTFHVSRITPIVASLNVVLTISILILILILFTKQSLALAFAGQAPLARLEVTDMKGGYPYPHQATDLQAHGPTHAPDLPIAPFVQDEDKPGVPGVLVNPKTLLRRNFAQHPHLGPGRTIFQQHAPP